MLSPTYSISPKDLWIMIVTVARESGGMPFDIKDVELSHIGERCSFDIMLKLFGLENEPSRARLALNCGRRRHRTARYHARSGRSSRGIAWPAGTGLR